MSSILVHSRHDQPDAVFDVVEQSLRINPICHTREKCGLPGDQNDLQNLRKPIGQDRPWILESY
jgi:hypothetical protein